MLSSALRRNVRNRTFKYFKQSLLYALAAYITGYGRVFRLSGNLVNLVDIDYSPLGALNIIIRRLNKAEKNVFHILADIARFGKGGSVGNRNRNIEYLCQSLREQGFTNSRRSKH